MGSGGVSVARMGSRLRTALAEGRAADGETQEIAGFRQAEAVMRMWERT